MEFLRKIKNRDNSSFAAGSSEICDEMPNVIKWTLMLDPH